MAPVHAARPLFLDERVALLGTALVLGGAWLTSRRETHRVPDRDGRADASTHGE